eukprot:3681050-Rhodomonas_salina.1
MRRSKASMRLVSRSSRACLAAGDGPTHWSWSAATAHGLPQHRSTAHVSTAALYHTCAASVPEYRSAVLDPAHVSTSSPDMRCLSTGALRMSVPESHTGRNVCQYRSAVPGLGFPCSSLGSRV